MGQRRCTNYPGVRGSFTMEPLVEQVVLRRRDNPNGSIYRDQPVWWYQNREFEAYTELLEDVGIDVSNSPRVPEPENR